MAGGTREIHLPRPPGGPAPWLVCAALAALGLLTVVTASTPVDVVSQPRSSGGAGGGGPAARHPEQLAAGDHPDPRAVCRPVAAARASRRRRGADSARGGRPVPL